MCRLWFSQNRVADISGNGKVVIGLFNAQESGANCGETRCAVRWDSASNTTTTIDIHAKCYTKLNRNVSAQ
jgi:hypothetical protein